MASDSGKTTPNNDVVQTLLVHHDSTEPKPVASNSRGEIRSLFQARFSRRCFGGKLATIWRRRELVSLSLALQLD